MNGVIIDDEQPAREELKWFVGEYSHINILGLFEDGVQALTFLQDNPVDVVFLDINMPRLDGLQLSKILRNQKKAPLVVFVTAHREYAVEAFELEAFDYLLKPFSESRIVSLLKRLEQQSPKETPQSLAKGADKQITLLKNEKLIVIRALDILFAEAQEREVRIVTSKETFYQSTTFSDFLRKLPAECFFRCHRSYLVNLTAIVEIIPWFNNTYKLKIRDTTEEVPVSRQQAAEFKRIMEI